MSINAHIRQYQPSDKKHVLTLFRLNSPDYFDPSEEKGLSYYLDKYSDHYFIIESEGLIVGSGGINFPKNKMSADISWDMIHPDCQGKGFGQKLMEFRLQFIRENSPATEVKLRTSQFTYKFYEKMGFEVVDKKSDFWAHGYDLYRMKMKIDRT